MARKIIDIGVVGNDGTGDSIRDSFRKVNDNFRELYSSLGLGEKLTFINLDDTPESYIGQVDRATGAAPILSVNPTESGLVFKQLVQGLGIQIDHTDTSITITSAFSEISRDDSPQLGGALNAFSGAVRNPIGNLPDIRDTVEFQAAVSQMTSTHGGLSDDPDRIVVNKGYADTKIALAGVNAIDPETGTKNIAFGTMTGPLILARDPEPDDDEVYGGLIAATKRYVDNSSFGSSVNLYVATSGSDDRPGLSRSLQGRALSYAYRSIEAALRRAEELIADAPFEIGPYKKLLTYNNGSVCTLSGITVAEGSGSGFAGVPLMSVEPESVELVNIGSNYYAGDILTLVGGTVAPDGQATKIEVLTTTGSGGTANGGIVTFRVISTGVYTTVPGSANIATFFANPSTDSASPSGIGAIGVNARFKVTYKVSSISITNGGTGYGLVSVRIEGGGGTSGFGEANIAGGVVTGITVTNPGTGFTSSPTVIVNLPRFEIKTDFYRTDFTGDISTTTPETIAGRDIREGLYLYGEESGALAQILSHKGELDTDGNELFDVDIKSGIFKVGEAISYGDVTKSIQISVLIESGIYEENYPLKVPQNVALIGDEFRRVIVKPRASTSSSPWAFQKFRRDLTIDGNQTASQLFGYHYLTDSSQPVYPKINNKGGYKSAATLLQLNRSFLQEEVIAWIDYKIFNGGTPFTTSFEYNSELCKRDVGLIIDAITFDIKYSGYDRTISAGLKYYQNASGLLAIGAQLSQTLAAIDKLESLMQSVITNTEIATTYQTFYSQTIDRAYISETGASGVITALITALKDVMDGSGSVNYPKENDRMDIFLCNDAVIIRALTCQGHGGFMMVLDPTGQVLAKSPYAQECASFSKSTGRKTFAGGMFSDGFTGNLQFKHTSTIAGTGNSRITVSGLDRFPQLPASFIVNDTVYRINYVRDYEYSPAGSTATFVLDENTPFPLTAGETTCTISIGTPAVITKVDHGLQPGSTIVFSNTGGSLPTGIVAGREYYVLADGITADVFRITETFNSSTPVTTTSTGSGTQKYQRLYEVLMPGNRSMLANDFTQIDDLGYGAVAHNGGLMELVSMFTYYCHISYYALNGGQIRSVSGSSAHGNYALVAEGADPLELPQPCEFYTELAQTAKVYAATPSTQNEKGGTAIYVTYDDFFPLSGTEIEINHGGGFTRYATSSIDSIDVVNKIAKLNISTSGGLVAKVPHGQSITLRNNAYHVLTGDVVNVATRPSTALLLNESSFVYRVLDFDDYDARYDKETYVITAVNIATDSFVTDIPHRQKAGYQVRFRRDPGAVLPSAVVAGESLGDSNIYYVAEVLSDTEFKISNTDGGAILDLSAGPAYSGTAYMVPYGLSITQLRQNYDYAEVQVFSRPPVNSTGYLGITSVNASTDIFSKVGHGLTVGAPIRIRSSGGDVPGGVSSTNTYFVISKNFTANQFSISGRAPIDSTFIGVTYASSQGPTITSIAGTGPYTAQITNITSLEELASGLTIVSKPNITGVSVVGDGTKATLTFATRQPLPPYLPLQQIVISGFSGAGAAFNGTQTVFSCTDTQVTFLTTSTGSEASNGVISVVQTGSLGTNTTITLVSKSTGTIGIISDTLPSAGTIVFQAEGSIIDVTSSGTGTIQYGKVLGEQGDTQFAVSDLGEVDSKRILNGISVGEYYKFVFEGSEHEITNYVPPGPGVDYGVLTVTPALNRSVIRYVNTVTLKAGLPARGTLAQGNLQIRISLTRVTSHDLLEIGTGSYADTNYPNEIYGQAKNSILDVPSFATDENENGELVTRAEMQERGSGRVFYVTTDQFGNFNVGPYFRVDQGTGTITFSASIALSQLDGLGFKRGRTVSEFSDSVDAGRVDSVPTEAAIRTYFNKRLGLDQNSNVVGIADRIPAGDGGFVAVNGKIPMIADLDMDTNRIRRLKNPVEPTDAVNLQSLTFANLQEIDFNNPTAGQIPILVGANNVLVNTTQVGDITTTLFYPVSTTLVGAYITDSSVIEIDSGIEDESQEQVNDGIVLASVVGFPTTGGYIKINSEVLSYTSVNIPNNRLEGVTRAQLRSIGSAHAAGSTVSLLKDVEYRSSITTGVIINTDVKSDAAIEQRKLDLLLASGTSAAPTLTTVNAGSFVVGKRYRISVVGSTSWTAIGASANTVGVIFQATGIGSGSGQAVDYDALQAISGLSSVNNSEFDVTNGWISLKNNGTAITKIAQIAAKRVLGNSSLTTTGNVAEIPFSDVVNIGDGVKKVQFSGTGFLRRKNTTNPIPVDGDFEIIEMAAGTAAAPQANRLIVRDSNGDFGARIADLSQLKLDNKVSIDTSATASGGFIRYYGYDSAGGILISNGTLAADKKTLYWNDQHNFKTQDGSFDAPITASSVQCTTLTTGGNTTGGNITGRWTLTGTSPNESRLQATYSADLAEYYEGDKEYEVGTVLIFGGEKEVTISNRKSDHRIAGVVSNTAAFVMYDACPGFKNLVALQGRVPCKVVGTIEKGDLLITSSIPGVAISAGGNASVGTIVGKALKNYDSDHIGTIEIAVGRT